MTVAVIVVVIVVIVPVVVTVAIVSVVVMVPVVVVSVIVVPVVRPPGVPVHGVVTPVPGRVPAYVVWVVDEPDHRPGSDLIICGSYHLDIVCIDCRACVAGIRCFCVNGFDDIVLSVKQLVTYELYLH